MTVTSPKTLKEKKATTTRIIALGILTVLIIIFLFSGFGKKAYNAVFATPTSIPDPKVQVLEAGVTAMFTLEYNGDYDSWLEKNCSLSTEFNCLYFTKEFGPGMWAAANEAQTNSTVSNVHTIMMLEANPDPKEPAEMWAVAYTYDNWNGTNETFDYFLIAQEDGVWKFDGAVLLPQTTLDQMYGAKLTPQPTTQP
jgi:hypothetical protein